MKKLCLFVSLFIIFCATTFAQDYRLDDRRPIGDLQPIPIPMLKTLNFFPASLKVAYGHDNYTLSGLIYNTGSRKFRGRLPVKLEVFEIENPLIPADRVIKRTWTKTFYVSGTIQNEWFKYFSVKIPFRKVPFEGYYKITVDPKNQIKETDEKDNTGHVGQHGVY